MRVARVAVALVAATVLVAAGAARDAHSDGHRPATLSVWQEGAWRAFWRSDRAPPRWTAADPSVARSLHWQRLAKGLDWTSLRLACGAPVWRARIIVARLDPRDVRLTLEMDFTRDEMRPAWSVDRTPGDALLAVNAGQFVSTMPWGWVVIDGRQHLRPGYGPLASAVGIDGAGRVRWSHGDSLAQTEGVVTGFQSYPTLLAGDGVVPPALRTGGGNVTSATEKPVGGINLTHRDARLAFGQTRDGRILIAMTRFDAVGAAGGGVPLGPTTPEMAAIMGALGACDAVMLDGGISAQLLLRDPRRKAALEWRGLRKVPLALIARPREAAEAENGGHPR